jgi:hypothetical protein
MLIISRPSANLVLIVVVAVDFLHYVWPFVFYINSKPCLNGWSVSYFGPNQSEPYEREKVQNDWLRIRVKRFKILAYGSETAKRVFQVVLIHLVLIPIESETFQQTR